MSLTIEDLDKLEFEIVKQKYYNANKVNAKLDELKPAIVELINENEALRKRSKEESDDIAAAGEALIKSAQQIANATIKEAQAKADKIVADANVKADGIIAGARTAGGAAPASAAKDGLSVAQLDLIDEINRQLDSLNTSQATQIMKIKQKLMNVAIN